MVDAVPYSMASAAPTTTANHPTIAPALGPLNLNPLPMSAPRDMPEQSDPQNLKIKQEMVDPSAVSASASPAVSAASLRDMSSIPRDGSMPSIQKWICILSPQRPNGLSDGAQARTWTCSSAPDSLSSAGEIVEWERQE
jgi:hypothetical protein